jgi:hypothetical protein
MDYKQVKVYVYEESYKCESTYGAHYREYCIALFKRRFKLCVCAKGEHFKPYIDKQQSS